jgi:hypothetical protein
MKFSETSSKGMCFSFPATVHESSTAVLLLNERHLTENHFIFIFRRLQVLTQEMCVVAPAESECVCSNSFVRNEDRSFFEE